MSHEAAALPAKRKDYAFTVEEKDEFNRSLRGWNSMDDDSFALLAKLRSYRSWTPADIRDMDRFIADGYGFSIARSMQGFPGEALLNKHFDPAEFTRPKVSARKIRAALKVGDMQQVGKLLAKAKRLKVSSFESFAP